jgi:hypothetical protein
MEIHISKNGKTIVARAMYDDKAIISEIDGKTATSLGLYELEDFQDNTCNLWTLHPVWTTEVEIWVPELGKYPFTLAFPRDPQYSFSPFCSNMDRLL